MTLQGVFTWILLKQSILTLPIPCILESFIKIKINLSIFFTLLCDALKGFMNVLQALTKKCGNKILSYFSLFVPDRDDTNALIIFNSELNIIRAFFSKIRTLLFFNFEKRAEETSPFPLPPLVTRLILHQMTT